jgi:cysteinyl-tRNA synthetase
MEKFRQGLEDDLNTHIALEAFFEVINVMNEKYSNGKLSKVFYTTALEAIEKMNSVLGILKDYEIPKKVIELAEKRKSLRKENAWDLADGVRKDILEEGFKIIDLKNSEYIILRNRKYGR